MGNESIRAANDAHVINTYGARRMAMARGEGARLWDADGREYLDFFAGIAVCNLGHCHPKVTEAVCRQAATLVHVSNLYYIEPQVQLAETLSRHCFAQRWFFCNGGAEANEAAIKLARRYWAERGTPRPDVITAEQSFHGRTLGSLTATGQPKYHHGFEPLVPGFQYVPYDDIAALEAAITPEVGLILLEPIQGEGGVRVPKPGYLRAVRELCDKHNILLALDEVQTGLGRTGKLFCHEHDGITPDIMTLAKGLGNGVPIGAMGCTGEAAAGFAPGAHACTFGGNPLSAAAALATMGVLTEPGFIQAAAEKGEHLHAALRALAEDHPGVLEVRGRGLMAGVECAEAVAPLVSAMLDAGIICGPAGPNVLRFLPPLIVSGADIDRAVETLGRCLGELGW
ncbi:MAG: acetylornithine transaminase [Candidatus Hydrogenedens sp.]|nr:acetylornithine transaminase [Candidatus Hydrogenedentota bacterium]NLF58391.1 acetylornithine transaminase [Candidatus Hydrogenedens sp.]